MPSLEYFVASIFVDVCHSVAAFMPGAVNYFSAVMLIIATLCLMFHITASPPGMPRWPKADYAADFTAVASPKMLMPLSIARSPIEQRSTKCYHAKIALFASAGRFAAMRATLRAGFNARIRSAEDFAGFLYEIISAIDALV